MHRIDGDNAKASLPTPQAVGATVGYFGAEDDPPWSQVTGDWLNAVQEEPCEVIENAGITLDKTDRTQLRQAIEAGLASSATSRAGSTLHDAAIVVVDDCGAFGNHSLVAASKNSDVEGDKSAMIACDFTGATTAKVTGDSSAMIACDGNAGNPLVSGSSSAAICAFGPLISNDFDLIAASDSCEITRGTCAIIGSSSSKIRSNAGGTTPNNIVMLASSFCDFDAGADGAAQRRWAVAGGYHASSLVAPSWRIESNGGTMRSTAAHTTSGLDYAEMFPNADGKAHPPARILTGEGRGVRLAKKGSRVRGTVSVSPTVVGGDDGIAWAKRYERDDRGALKMETVKVERQVYDDTEVAAYAKRRAELVAELREARDPIRGERLVELHALLSAPWKGKAPEGESERARVRRERREKAKAKRARKPLGDEWRTLEVAYRGEVKAVRERRAETAKAIATLEKPAPKTITEKVTQAVLNPAWDPKREQVSRRDRPDQWTCVGLVGQVPVDVDASVKVGGFVAPSDAVDSDGIGGIGTHSDEPARGRPIECMEIVSPFDPKRGYAIALCLIG